MSPEAERFGSLIMVALTVPRLARQLEKCKPGAYVLVIDDDGNWDVSARGNFSADLDTELEQRWCVAFDWIGVSANKVARGVLRLLVLGDWIACP